MELHFKLSVNDVNVILEALGHMPINRAGDTYAEFKTQALNQMTPPDPAREAKDMSDART